MAALVACAGGGGDGQRRAWNHLWALDEVPRFHLRLDEAAMASLARQPKQQVRGRFSWDSRVVDDVAVRLKGHRSLRPIGDKPSFKVRFDEWKKQRLAGARSLTLNNLVEDPTLLRELLGYRLFRAMGVAAPEVGYAELYVNGRPYGLYAVIETIDEEFLERNFEADDGGLYEGEWGCDLYPEDVPGFEKDHGPPEHDDLAALAEAAAGPADALFFGPQAPVDLRRFLDYLAVSALIGDFDGYRHSHNYRIYLDPGTGRWSFIPWGIDRAFKKSLPLTDSEGLLARRCFADRACRLQYYRTLLDAAEQMERLRLDRGILAVASVIDGFARADPRRHYNEADISQARGELVDFLRRRPGEVRAQLTCLGPDGAEVDADGDGFGCLDCDDRNAAVHPGAAEVCNRVDDDCSGLVDDAPACPCREQVIDGVAFELCDLPMGWTDAAGFCAARGRSLARIDSAAQSAALYAAARKLNDGRWWIGLSDRTTEGDFRWTDGSAPAPPNWARGEPDNDGCHQDCAALKEDAAGKWHDTHCAQRRPFVCR